MVPENKPSVIPSMGPFQWWKKVEPGLLPVGVWMLASVFLLAGLSKVADLRAFHESLSLFSWLPAPFRGVLALTVPSMEIILAAALLLRYELRWTAALATILMGAFVLVALDGAFFHPHAGGCGCLPAKLQRHLSGGGGGGWVFRNLLLLGLSVWIWRRYEASQQ